MTQLINKNNTKSHQRVGQPEACSWLNLAQTQTLQFSDDSNFGCGASIMQRIDNAWCPRGWDWHAFATT